MVLFNFFFDSECDAWLSDNCSNMSNFDSPQPLESFGVTFGRVDRLCDNKMGFVRYELVANVI